MLYAFDKIGSPPVLFATFMAIFFLEFKLKESRELAYIV